MLERYILQQVPSCDISKVVNEEKRLRFFLGELKKYTQVCAVDPLPGQDVASDLAGMKGQLKSLAAQVDDMGPGQLELFWEVVEYVEMKMRDLIAQEDTWRDSEDRFRRRRLEIAGQETRS